MHAKLKIPTEDPAVELYETISRIKETQFTPLSKELEEISRAIQELEQSITPLKKKITTANTEKPTRSNLLEECRGHSSAASPAEDFLESSQPTVEHYIQLEQKTAQEKQRSQKELLLGMQKLERRGKQLELELEKNVLNPIGQAILAARCKIAINVCDKEKFGIALSTSLILVGLIIIGGSIYIGGNAVLIPNLGGRIATAFIMTVLATALLFFTVYKIGCRLNNVAVKDHYKQCQSEQTMAKEAIIQGLYNTSLNFLAIKFLDSDAETATDTTRTKVMSGKLNPSSSYKTELILERLPDLVYPDKRSDEIMITLKTEKTRLPTAFVCITALLGIFVFIPAIITAGEIKTKDYIYPLILAYTSLCLCITSLFASCLISKFGKKFPVIETIKTEYQLLQTSLESELQKFTCSSPEKGTGTPVEGQAVGPDPEELLTYGATRVVQYEPEIMEETKF